MVTRCAVVQQLQVRQEQVRQEQVRQEQVRQEQVRQEQVQQLQSQQEQPIKAQNSPSEAYIRDVASLKSIAAAALADAEQLQRLWRSIDVTGNCSE
jgi:hypothetical protein